MNSIPSKPSPSDEGLARLRQALKDNPDIREELRKLLVIARTLEDPVSLDALKEAGKDPHADDTEGAEDLVWFLSVMQWAHEAGSEEWIEKLLSTDTEQSHDSWISWTRKRENTPLSQTTQSGKRFAPSPESYASCRPPKNTAGRDLGSPQGHVAKTCSRRG